MEILSLWRKEDVVRDRRGAVVGLLDRTAQGNLRSLLRSDTPEQVGAKRSEAPSPAPHHCGTYAAPCRPPSDLPFPPALVQNGLILWPRRRSRTATRAAGRPLQIG